MSPSSPPPLKRFGQHFLIDQNIVRKIVELAAIEPHETVLEIGPGRGILTQPLCDKTRKVIAIEIDRQLAKMLITACPNLDLRIGDALEFEYGTLPQGTVVVANLPYYVSTPLLFKLLDASPKIDRLVLMMQMEVAQRLAAKPGTKEYGVLSVLTQYKAEVTVAFRVSPHCFRPRPTVGSAVVHLLTRTARSLDHTHERRFAALTRAAFAHRRKTVVNSLRDEGYAMDAVTAALGKCNIAPDRRAESLSLEDYLALAAALDNEAYPESLG
ncbi:MAG TPA: 16S rRNA (adenine(1518)-N(6)/adenine(1519)-N(6))-dimethyltransferase RsmA [Nitrospiraceae bacterium]|nr:16S rRNA (adenine(1518)-N(6)/adenine(1519)-N(6))-dimethyltransferase RsmA [Nitrospiraceae bacterium]